MKPTSASALDRRSMLRNTFAAAAASAFFSFSSKSARAAGLPMPIDTATLTKYIDPLPLPVIVRPNAKTATNITMTQFQTRLHSQLPMTTVWGYNGSYPGVTIEAQSGVATRVRFTNALPQKHLLPIDPSIDGAYNYMLNTPNPEVRTITHLHGGHSRPEHDGFPEQWYVPGSSRDHIYDNNQPASTLWYHDHAMGSTRLNVYAGLAGFYLIRDKVETALNLPRGTFEVPLAIQDRCFNPDGSLFYPTSREYFDGYAGPYNNDPVTPTDVPPVWNPEFFGNAMVVNGKVWPYLNVFKSQYRFRLLNGCCARTLILQLSNGGTFHQIGSDSGFLPTVVKSTQLLLAAGERADVIIDFSTLPVGTKVQLLNLGPDSPFGGMAGMVSADPATTGQVMEFRVAWDPAAKTVKNKTAPPVPATTGSTGTPVAKIKLPAVPKLPASVLTRKVSLNELASSSSPAFDGPVMGLLGTMQFDQAMQMDMPMPMRWMHPATETPKLGTCETWEIHNFTMDAHPIHLHLVAFEVVGRIPGGAMANMAAMNNTAAAAIPMLPPEPHETGRKDTVVCYPGDITVIKALFDIKGNYVWHCHILDHEDNEMMRPLTVI